LRFADAIVRRRRIVVWLTLALTVAAVPGALRLRVNADFVTYLSADNPVVRVYHHVADVFGGNETGMVLLTAPDVYRPDVLALIDSLTSAYESIDGVAYVTSLANTLDFAATEWGVEVGRLIRRGAIPTAPSELEALRHRVGVNPRLVGNLVSADGTVAAIQVRLTTDTAAGQVATLATVQRVIQTTADLIDDSMRATPVAAHFGGMPFLMYQIARQITGNMVLLVPLMVMLLIVVLYVGLRHWSGVLYPLVVVVVSSVVVLGTMGLLGLSIDLLSGLVPIVLIVMGSADGIHFMKRYHERRGRGEAADAAAAATYREIQTPLVLTTITTMIAFGSLAISDVAIIRQFGLLTALGLLAALVVTLTLLPSLAAFGVGAPRPRRTAGESTLMGGVSRLVTRAPGRILALGGVGIAIAGLGSVLIVKSVDWTLCLQQGSPPHRAELLLRDKLGGSLPVQLLARGDVLDPAVLVSMRRLERRLQGLTTVSQSQSVAGLLAEMNAALNGRYAVPETPEGVANLWFLVEDEPAVGQLIVPGAPGEALVQARVSDWETRSIRAAVSGIDAWLDEHQRMFALDERTLEEVMVARVRRAKIKQLVTELAWEFTGRGAAAPASTEEVVRRFVEWRPNVTTRSTVERALDGYLVSEEAEAELPPTAARELAQRLAAGAGVQRPDSSAAAAAIRGVMPRLALLDRGALALSLARIVDEVVGSRRVAEAVTALAEEAPDLTRDPVLDRNIRGILWEAHGPLFVFGREAAQRWGLEVRDEVREVPVQFARSGLASVLERMEAELLPTQIQSVLLTLLVVVLLLAVIFRSPTAGLVMVLPLTATIVVNFGAMGYLSLGLDSFTAMVASIAIGLGVDYAIHFTHRLRSEVGRGGGSRARALHETLQSCGVAILVNAVSVGLGFLVLLAATCQHIRRFGGLTSLAMLAAGSFTLLLLPALYAQLRPRFVEVQVPRSGSSSGRHEPRRTP
jgi:predicted RND superfamily exporter protein